MFQRIINAFVAKEILDRKDEQDHAQWSSVSDYIHNAVVPLLKSWLERRGQVTRPSALSAVVNIELMQGISRAAERVACILETDLELARKSQDEDSAIGRHVVDALEAVACMAPRECDLAIPNFAVDAVATKISDTPRRRSSHVQARVSVLPRHFRRPRLSRARGSRDGAVLLQSRHRRRD